MRSGIVAIWEEDRTYSEKLVNYLRRQGELGSMVVSFSAVEKLRQAVERGQVSVLVAGCSIENESWIQETRVVFLTDSGTRWSEEETGHSSASERRYFYKYQSVRNLVRCICMLQQEAVANENRESDVVSIAHSSGSIASLRGIYSPVGGCLKTSLGLVMGCLLAEERRCLFLSLEAHGGFRTLFGRQYPLDLSDLFACLRQNGNLGMLLSEALQPFGKLWYVPPVIWPVDIREAEFSELRELLYNLAMCGRFDEIILDVGQDLACPEQVLVLCDRIYQPEKEDVFSRAKLAEYEAYLRISGQEEICERTQRIPLSQLTDGTKELPLDQWQRWEQMIPVVRHILKGEGYEK